MKAILWTRCGCSQEVVTTFPPPAVIAMPLRAVKLTKIEPFAGDWKSCVGQVRFFELAQDCDPGPTGEAHYGEVIK